ncbi:MAG: GMC family oxidoreductase [Saprospiraceae bacterium]|nr:GMC family oxidoreductase [Saprospiraceae bacterium]MBP7923035.1 GMC family oxidoreductase [Saprospiraceae bacterium]MBP8942339.1 GMC family oxidoreductase [Saprospiraceae bacterium]MBP9746296.1 GMC family oxidoreductase [Saprospiraceae bacterium]
MQIKENPVEYDVVIVGSGAGGGMATYMLGNAGLKVCLLEAGPMYDPKKDITQFKWNWESPRRGASTDYRNNGDMDACYGGWELEGEPYTQHPGSKFDWFRARMMGGRTNHWGRISLRFGPRDFKHRSYDGLGEDWPISYDEIKPYYDRVDQMLGVFGTNEGLPNDPDGYFLPPPKPRLHELYIKKAALKTGVNVIPNRLSMLTKKINDERGVCVYCRQCYRGCQYYADFSASSCLVIPALKNKNVELICNAMAREVTTNSEGLATGISYIDKNTLQEYHVKARSVILTASACESARLLLNSKSTQHSNGLANSSNMVGKYLHDSTGKGMRGILPALMDHPRYNEDGVGGAHVYSPWWLDNKKLDFPRGYHIEYSGGLSMPSYGFGWGIENSTGLGAKHEAGGYGSSLKQDYRRLFGASVGMAGRGEAIARMDNFCEIDPSVVDKYGIPVLKFQYKWSDYEIKQAKHMQQTFQEILTNMGATITSGLDSAENNWGLAAPGRIIHEVGTVRMMDDSKKGPLNRNCQAHDCKNLFVADGGPFVSQADKNPTWTILALSMRAADYIIDQMKKKEI